MATPSSLFTAKIETLRLDPAPGMTRAELHFVRTVPFPKAVLVLSPGCNGNGSELVHSLRWQEFARSHQLGLVGLSFASPSEAMHDGTGYYYAAQGSGKKLLEGLRRIYGHELPVLMYGFSGGAHFASRFVEWRPDQVIAWCAYSAGWWDDVKSSVKSPPGLVACGDEDQRLGASLMYFKQGRAAGKPWLWIGLSATGHTSSHALDHFVREYFSAILTKPHSRPLWVDIDRKIAVPRHEAELYPSLTGQLPSQDLFASWTKLHTP